MDAISCEQRSIIRSRIEQSQISSQTLREDILDHLCCLVEEKMSSGKRFEIAFEEAILEFGPGPLGKIQAETDFLLQKNKIIPMKKLLYAIGLVTSMSSAMGLMMKLLHMPGGEELVNFGFLGFAFLFLPMATLRRYRTDPAVFTHEKCKMLFGFLSAVMISLAVLFKMNMELEAAEILLISGTSIFSFGFLPLFFFGMYKRSASYRAA